MEGGSSQEQYQREVVTKSGNSVPNSSKSPLDFKVPNPPISLADFKVLSLALSKFPNSPKYPAEFIVPNPPERPAYFKVPNSPKRPAEFKVPNPPERPAYFIIPNSPKRPPEFNVPNPPELPAYFKVPNSPKRPPEFKVPNPPERPAYFIIPNSPKRPPEFNVPNPPELPAYFKVPNSPKRPPEFNVPNPQKNPAEFKDPNSPKCPAEFNVPNPQKNPAEFKVPNPPQNPADFKAPNSPKSPADFNSSLHKLKGKIQKRSTRSSSGITPTTSAAQCSSSSQITKNTKLTFKDQQMNRLVFQQGGLPDGSEVVYVSHGMKLLKGYKWGRGIFCFCCNTEVSPSQFEAHAGQASRKKPYGNIYVSNGVSLHEYASSLKLTCGHLSKKNDELCGVCKKDGNLLLCDGCPRSFHKECVSDTSAPKEKWFCKYCRNSMKHVVQHSGIDPIGQIEKRCIRIIYNPNKSDLVACGLCRAYDFNTIGFNDRTVIVCDQCEREYHIGCLRTHKKIDLKELPSGNWFCTVDCGILHSVLEKLVACGPVKVPDSLMGSIRKKSNASDVNGIGITNSDMKWIVFRGKDVSDENKVLLSQAVDIFHKCFNPIVDAITGSDFIPSMAYGQTMGDSDFTGVHCAMLTIESKVVTAGMFRVFGADVAELPIVATSEHNQGKGYFGLFFKCFEKLVAYLKVKKMVVPAAENVKSMWIQKFGFEKVTPTQLSEYRQTLTSMVAFQGTSLLEKEVVVPRGGVTFQDGVAFSLSMKK